MSKPKGSARILSKNKVLETKRLICLHGEIALHPEFETYLAIQEAEDELISREKALQLEATPLINAVLNNDVEAFKRLAEIAQHFAEEEDAPDEKGLAILDAILDLYGKIKTGRKGKVTELGINPNRVARWIEARPKRYTFVVDGVDRKTISDAMETMGVWPEEKLHACLENFV